MKLGGKRGWVGEWVVHSFVNHRKYWGFDQNAMETRGWIQSLSYFKPIVFAGNSQT